VQEDAPHNLRIIAVVSQLNAIIVRVPMTEIHMIMGMFVVVQQHYMIIFQVVVMIVGMGMRM
jgi:hypothetical protein